MNNSQVSIIIPIYNAEKFLHRTIPNIITQVYKNIEIILVNDGSTDSSGQICECFCEKDKRIKVFHKKNGGLSDARNYGVQKATSNFIVFCDADDCYESFAVEYLLKVQQKYNADLVISNILLTNSYSKRDYCLNNKDIENSCLVSKENLFENIYYGKMGGITACAKLYRKDILLNNPYPFEKMHEDFDTYYRVVSDCKKIAYGNLVTYNHIINEKSLTSGSFGKEMLYYFEAGKHNLEYIQKYYPNNIKIYKGLVFMNTVAGLPIIYKMIQAGLNKEVKEYQKEFRKYLKYIIFNKNIKFKRKVGYYIFISSISIYTFLKGVLK